MNDDFEFPGAIGSIATGKCIVLHRNGEFENGKNLYVQPNWSRDDLLCHASQRLELTPLAKFAYNANGTEVTDVSYIQDHEIVFVGHGPFKDPPLSNGGNGADAENEEEWHGVIGGYKVGSFLGKGGFGEVRLGVHALTNEKVALKFIQKRDMGTLVDAERTVTEIQCLTALKHPHIIKLLGVHDEPEHIVLVFELLMGGDLSQYMARDAGPTNCLTEDEARDVFKQILAGVAYAHNHHICHRDLKLENILLTNLNDVQDIKVADFGLSDFYRPGEVMKSSCGSISYLAPEVFRGTSNAGPPLDVWALGVILFGILCGRLPFEGPDLRGTRRPDESAVRTRITLCQYKVDEHLSPEVKDLLRRMLRVDPNERASIPEMFNHVWLRGRKNTMDMEMSFESIQSEPKTKDAGTCGNGDIDLKASKRDRDRDRDRDHPDDRAMRKQTPSPKHSASTSSNHDTHAHAARSEAKKDINRRTSYRDLMMEKKDDNDLHSIRRGGGIHGGRYETTAITPPPPPPTTTPFSLPRSFLPSSTFPPSFLRSSLPPFLPSSFTSFLPPSLPLSSPSFLPPPSPFSCHAHQPTTATIFTPPLLGVTMIRDSPPLGGALIHGTPSILPSLPSLLSPSFLPSLAVLPSLSFFLPSLPSFLSFLPFFLPSFLHCLPPDIVFFSFPCVALPSFSCLLSFPSLTSAATTITTTITTFLPSFLPYPPSFLEFFP
jgi:serine/threonine protein kinase